jgi:hypothetical protein
MPALQLTAEIHVNFGPDVQNEDACCNMGAAYCPEENGHPRSRLRQQQSI